MGEARFQHVRKTPDIGEMHNLYSRDYDNQDKLQNVDEILATHFAPPFGERWDRDAGRYEVARGDSEMLSNLFYLLQGEGGFVQQTTLERGQGNLRCSCERFNAFAARTKQRTNIRHCKFVET